MTWKKSRGIITASLGAVLAFTAATSQAATYSEQVNFDGPIRYYRLGEAAGPTAVDQKGLGNGTYVNFSPGDFSQGGALVGDPNTSVLFDGVNNTVTAPNAPDLALTGDMTVEFWMNKNAEAGDWQRLVGKGTQTTRTFGVWEEAGAGKRILFQQYNGANSQVLNFFSNSTVEIGQWHHVVATLSGNNAAIYIDGKLDAVSTKTGGNGVDADPLTIGKAPDIHTFFPGRLDEVAVYNKALNQFQVHQHYLTALGNPVQSLPNEVANSTPTAYYQFNDGPIGSQPGVLNDSAPPPNNGSYFNGVTMVAGKPFIPGTAASFDGSNDFARLPSDIFSPFTTGGPMTFETWFNTTTGGVILGQTGAGSTPGGGQPAGWVPAVHVGTDGILRSEMFWHGAVAPINAPTALNDGQWHHIVTTFDSGTQNLYVDGVLVASAAGRAQSLYAGGSPANYDYYLGTGYTNSWPGGNGGWHYFQGLLDDTAVYQRALTLDEVRRHFTAGNIAQIVLPEPGTALLALLGAVGLGRRRRRD